jgi:ubiquinone/menaquinone biosynthesis C-methylase UbiE
MDSYGELCTLFYDMDKPTAPALALEWYAQRLPRENVLEPMCGSGRFLVPLLQQGFQVSGVDPSDAMLDACRARLAALGMSAPLFQQSLQELDLPSRYAAAFIPASSFCLIAEPDEALQQLRRHLLPGATLLLEFEKPRLDAGPGKTSRIVTRGSTQIRLESRSEYDAQTGIETFFNRYELKKSGRVVQTESEILKLCSYKPQALESLLLKAGFQAIKIEHPAFGHVAIGGA